MNQTETEKETRAEPRQTPKFTSVRFDDVDAEKAYAALDEAVHALFEEGNPVGVKCALSVMGRIGDTMRLPLVAGSGKLRAKFEELIARYDLR